MNSTSRTPAPCTRGEAFETMAGLLERYGSVFEDGTKEKLRALRLFMKFQSWENDSTPLYEFEAVEPQPEWIDGDTVAGPTYVAWRQGGQWFTNHSEGRSWGDDEYVSSQVKVGWLTPLRKQGVRVLR